MRKVILFVQVSLDGFFEGPKKEIDWHMIDDELFGHVIEELKAFARIWLDTPKVVYSKTLTSACRERSRSLSSGPVGISW